MISTPIDVMPQKTKIMNTNSLLWKHVAKVFVLILCLASFNISAQTNQVTVTVDWADSSYENKVEIYDPANNLLQTICNSQECYQATGTNRAYSVTYDFGCLVTNNNYYIIIYDLANDGWVAGSSVTVNVAGTDVLTNDGSTANSTGVNLPFNVNSATLCAYDDTDPCSSRKASSRTTPRRGQPRSTSRTRADRSSTG